MSERPQQIDPRMIYISLLIIIVLAIVAKFSAEETSSAASVFLIVIIALGNIIYLYRRFKR